MNSGKRGARAAFDVIVVGGGAAGMLAAGSAAERGVRVLLLERGRCLGRKLSITGDGRCNLTNSDDMDEFVRAFGANGRFLYRAFSAFSNRDVVAFFRERGLSTKSEERGRIYPADDRAQSVVEALAEYMNEHGVSVRLDCRAERVVLDEASGAIAGVKINGRAEIIAAERVILATGGLSYPATGSTGDGFAMARALGHTVVPPRPALVPLETAEPFVRRLQGVSLSGVAVTARSGRAEIASETGDLIFTHYGISGPAVLAISGAVVEHLDRNEPVAVSINLAPTLDGPGMENALIGSFAASGRSLVGTAVRDFVPKALASVLLHEGGIPEGTRCGGITAAERKRLAALLADFRLTVKRPRPIAEAVVTRGGVDLKEIDPRTMESKKVRGLYFCGEIIDVDGRTGGYNLQAAFSTARLAAIHAAAPR